MAQRQTMTEKNAALREQLTAENQTYWDQLVSLLAQQPKFAARPEALQRQLHDLLTQVVAAQANHQSTADFFSQAPEKIAAQLGESLWQRPWWLTMDLWFPILLFFLGTILPTVILPGVPFQGLSIAVQFGLFLVALAIGIWLLPRFTTRGRTIGWGLIIVLLLLALGMAARLVPAVGLIYVTRKGGSLFLLALAVILTGVIVWDHRRRPDSWLPALTANLWITTALALLARVNPTATMMVGPSGGVLIILGTLLGDISILVIGWHIWRSRRER